MYIPTKSAILAELNEPMVTSKLSVIVFSPSSIIVKNTYFQHANIMSNSS